MGWKTILGGILTGLGTAATGGFTLEALVQGGGIILAAVGVRHAIAKR